LDPNCFNRLHRVAVVDENGIKNIISQSDLISFAEEHIHEIDYNLLNKTVAEHGYMVRTPIIGVSILTIIDALELLFKNRISGLALIDQDNLFCGNLSASDLRGMHPSSFNFFTRSVLSFLCKGVQQEYKGSISIPPDSNFRDTILVLNRNHIHRVYITKDNGYLLGVISLIDVISRL